jgi:hypothetical protein
MQNFTSPNSNIISYTAFVVICYFSETKNRSKVEKVFNTTDLSHKNTRWGSMSFSGCHQSQ